MLDQSGSRALALQRHHESCKRQFGSEMVAHGLADDLAAVEIHYSSQVQPAFAGRNVGDVSEPDAVWRRGREVAVEKVGRDRHCRSFAPVVAAS